MTEQATNAAQKIAEWIENSSDEELQGNRSAEESKSHFIAKAAAIIEAEYANATPLPAPPALGETK